MVLILQQIADTTTDAKVLSHFFLIFAVWYAIRVAILKIVITIAIFYWSYPPSMKDFYEIASRAWECVYARIIT